MSLIELLPAGAIVAELRSGAREQLFAQLCAPVAAATGIPARELVDALAEREAAGSTALGSGIAVPHGTHAGIDRIVASFGRSREGVSFDAPDDEPVHFFVALLRPSEATSAHLQALASIGQLLARADVRAELLAAPDAAAIEHIIRARG
jgi:nitrogen PTS system EIIA component